MPARRRSPCITRRVQLTPPRVWDQLAAVVRGGAPAAPLRVGVVAAHPDDETVSAGALLRRLARCTGSLQIIHVTTGAPRNGVDAREHGLGSVEAYARTRRAELVSALAASAIR